MPPEAENNQEILDALKEFESKQGSVLTSPPSADVDVMQSQRLVIPQAPDVSRMTRLVMKLSFGLVKNETGAHYVLLAFVIIALSLSVYLFFG